MEAAFEGNVFEWIAFFLGGSAGLGCLYLLIAAIVVLRHRVQAEKADAADIPVTILKPLHGDEPDLLRRLSSFCRQDYAGPMQIVFGVQRADDPAIAVVERLRVLFPDKDLALKIDAREHGHNRKVSNLINMSALARYETLILADSDIEVTPDYLTSVVAALRRPGVGAVTCLYHGTPGRGIGTKLSQLAINAHFLPNVMLAVNLRLAKPCFGSTIALNPEALAAIGGLAAFADVLADDYAIGEAVQAAGYEIALTPFSVGHACNQASIKEAWLHDLRVARTIKTIDPLGYVGSLVTNPLPLALIGAALGSVDALAVAGLAISCRVALALCVVRTFKLDHQPYWLLPLRDLAFFAIYFAGLSGRGVSWRGHRYRVHRDGKLMQKPGSARS